jgi:hypothetical protein
MKQIKNIVSSVVLISTMLVSNSCSDLLVEKPQSNIVPSAFASPAGLLGGIAGVYNDIRNTWGTEGFTVAQMIGTDETLEGGGASNYHQLATYNGLTGGNSNGGFGLYQDINTLNGILQLGPSTPGLDATTLNSYIGQAEFLRAFIYFYLVQTYGNIPLHTTFITKPTQADAPAPPGDIYKVIVADLTDAITKLPNTPTTPFLGKAATVGAAKWLLAKAYLTRGWLNSDNNDFTLAYNTATDLITNKATYGLDLWQDYYSAFLPANDYGKETIFVSDHSNDPKYGYYTPNGAQSGGNAINVTPWMGLSNMVSNIGVNSKLDPTKVASDPTSINPLYNPRGFVNSGSLLLNRDLQFGRPFGRIRPNMTPVPSGANAGKTYIFDQAFADRLNDSRYWKTFQVVWLVNSGPSGGGGQALNGTYSGNGPTGSRGTLKAGVDTAIWYSDYEVVNAPQAKGTYPFKGIIVTPSMQFANAYPYMKKLADPSRVNQNDPSTRPVVVARFSEVYLIAAEAAFKLGDKVNAAANLNIVRQRAAYHSGAAYAPGGAFGTTTPATMVGDPYPAGLNLGLCQAAMTITPAQVTLDFILDERTREFYGESMRWLDLTRTQSLVSRVKAWNPAAAPLIDSHHVIRPIPQDEINNVVAGEPYPQNPGY